MKPYYFLNMPELVEDIRRIYPTEIAVRATGGEDIMRKEGIMGYDDPVENGSAAFNELRASYPFLDRHVLTFNLRPNFRVLPHLDGHPNHGRIKQRPVSINIPISGCCDLAPTEFYDNPEDDFYLEKRFDVRVVKPGVELRKIDEYFLTDLPVLMNPQIPHSVDNTRNFQHRISVSWTLDLSFSWESAVAYFNERNLLM